MGPADGTPVENGAGGMFFNAPASIDSFYQVGLEGGITYYYTAFAADEIPDYSVGAMTAAEPTVSNESATWSRIKAEFEE